MAYNSPEEALGALIRAYYDERDVEAILSCVTDDIEWVGTEDNDNGKGKDVLRELLEADVAAFPNAFSVELKEPSVQHISPNVVIFTVVGKQIEIPKVVVGFAIRGTVCAVKTENGWLISNVHISVPNSEMEKMELQHELNKEKEKQAAILDAVSGGVAIYRVKKDGRIATDYVSDGLARICKYIDGKDIMIDMAYDSRKLVVQEDFPVVAAACKASLSQGVPTSVNYRIHAKDGSLVRITLDSVVMKNVELGEDDVAVFYAVQTLVNDETNRIIEDQKQMSVLLDQMPCGLGLFKYMGQNVYTNYMNNAFYELLGMRREDRSQYSGANTLGSAHSDDLPRINVALKKLMDGDSSVQIDYRINKEESEWVWIHANAVVVKREKESILLCIAFHDVTESKERELQLIQNQNAVELAQNQGGLAIWTYNIDKKLLIQQSPMDVEGHLGYPIYIENVPDSFVESGSIHPDDVEKYLAAYEKVENGEEKVDEVYRMINQQTGKYCWVHMFYQSMQNNMNGERMAVGFSMDADMQQEAIERYRVEETLRKQMYKDAVMYMEYNLMTCRYEGDNNLDASYLSQKWETTTLEGYRENMSTTVEDADLNLMVEKMYAKNLLKAFQRGETTVSCEYRSKARPNRAPIWHRTSAVMVQRPDNGDVMAFIYIQNIEKEKERQLALENSMSDGIESVAVIHVADGSARIIRSNSARIPKDIGEFFIYDDTFVARSHKAIIDEESEFGYTAARLSTVIKELSTKDVYQYSVSMLDKAGALKRRLFRFRYLDDRKEAIIMAISDITAVYVEEQEKKKQLEEALSNAQKASGAKAEFYSRMSHDMRTPMNGILGMADLSEDETDVAILKENMKKIRESGEYLLSLVNDTLDIQRIESGKLILEPQIVSTTDIVDNILDMVRVTAKTKDVNLKFSYGNTDLNWYIRADALRLKQIFINLLSNAIKFTPEGGTVAFEFKLIAREGMISHDVIYVRDTGIGMSKEFLANGIFKPFSQESNAVSSNYAGSGLGLSIAKSLVELMGGRIEVESELGVGTTFAVYLDFERVEEKEAKGLLKAKKKEKENVSTSLQGKKVLLAEDHPLNAEIAKKLLQKVGCEVSWAKDGKEAVALFEKTPAHSFDVILMDIRMPNMDGLEAAKKIRSLSNEDAARIPIIAMTANAYEEDIKASIQAGMNAHLGKPIVPQNLYETIAENIVEYKS